MPVTESPLRYPGGKTGLFPLVEKTIKLNSAENCWYVEPFAGGAGLALKLLFKGVVPHVVINDIDPAIYTFWHCVLNRTDELCELILETPVTTQEWKHQKELWSNYGNGNLLDFGFSTFYLNRTNVSGILKGGMIGGFEQNGNYAIDARFNKNNLIKKIRKIASYRSNIHIYNLDVIDFVMDVLPALPKAFVNFDPPYVKKGSSLYVNFYSPENHIALGKLIDNLNILWMVTYDNCTLIRNIYEHHRQFLIPIKYSAGTTKDTKEIAVFCDSMNLPDDLVANIL